MVITSQVKLILTEDQKREFEVYTRRSTDCLKQLIQWITEDRIRSMYELHKNYYAIARGKFELSADMTSVLMFKALKLAKDKKRAKKDRLVFKRTKVVGNEVRVTFGSRPVQIPFYGIVVQGESRQSEAKFVNGEWFLNISIEKEVPVLKNYTRFMGVDLGIAKTAVIADWNGQNTKFFGGEPFRFKKNHYQKLRASMSENLKKGNTYKAIKNISGKEARWVLNMNHEISREIVDIAVNNKRSIAVEKLTGITERLKVNKKTRKMLKGWSFRQLVDFIKYKAELSGILVLEVDPRQTSRTCPKCGHISRSNRKTQERFICVSCRYESNADRVAAMNIALRGTELLACR